MRRHYLIPAALFLVSAIASNACRSRARDAKVDGENMRVEISLLNLADEHKKDPTLNYFLNCDGEWIKGKFIKGKEKLEFYVKNVNVGDNCQLKVETLSPPFEIKFLKEKNVLYASKKLKISQNAKGQLEGTAVLATLFQNEQKTYRVAFAIQFKKPLPADVTHLRAKIFCTPEVNSISEPLTVTDAQKNICMTHYNSGFKEDTSYVCTSLQVQRDTSVDYFGTLNETFEVEAEKLKTLDMITVDSVDVANPSGILIITEAGGSCKSDEIFDLEKRACVKK